MASTHCQQRRHSCVIPWLGGPKVYPRESDKFKEGQYEKIALLLFKPWISVTDLLPTGKTEDGEWDWRSSFAEYEASATGNVRRWLQNYADLVKMDCTNGRGVQDEQDASDDDERFQEGMEAGAEPGGVAEEDEDDRRPTRERNAAPPQDDEEMNELLNRTVGDTEAHRAMAEELRALRGSEAGHSRACHDRPPHQHQGLRAGEPYTPERRKACGKWVTEMKALARVRRDREEHSENDSSSDGTPPARVAGEDGLPPCRMVPLTCTAAEWDQLVDRIGLDLDTMPTSERRPLNPEQMLAYKVFAKRLRFEATQPSECGRRPLRMYVRGAAGTGKSRLITAMQTLAARSGNPR